VTRPNPTGTPRFTGGGSGGDRDGRSFGRRPTGGTPATRPNPTGTPRFNTGGNTGGGDRDGRSFGSRPTNPGGGFTPRGPRPGSPRTDNPIGEEEIYGGPRNRGGYGDRGGFGRRGNGGGDGYVREGGDRDVGTYRHRDNRNYRGGYGRYHYGGYYRNRPRHHRHSYWVDRRRDFWRDRTRLRNSTRWIFHLNRGWGHDRYYGHWGRPTRWNYHTHYYTRGYDRRQFAYYDGICSYRDNGQATVIGAVLGAVIGGAAANDDDVLVGALLGAGIGGLFGNAVGRLDDCDKAQLHYGAQYAFEYGEPYYWGNPYTGVRGVLTIRDTYYLDNYECRYGDAEIYMPDGSYNYEQVRMCRDDYGDWFVAPNQY
jgi:surface antigen